MCNTMVRCTHGLLDLTPSPSSPTPCSTSDLVVAGEFDRSSSRRPCRC